MANSISQLSVPHLGIGAGIGAVDAALVPLLATLADSQRRDRRDAHATYGATLALGQTAVSLAYCLGSVSAVVSEKQVALNGPFRVEFFRSQLNSVGTG